MKLGCLPLLAVAWLACAGPAAAFNDPGHLQSVRLVVEGLDEPKDPAERKLVAACAQLPDLSQELDAAKTYYEALSASWWDWARWGTSDRLNNAALQRMFAVQQLVHGLTGGDPMALRAAALGTLRELLRRARALPPGQQRLEALCATGLSLHLWGDAFAHTEVLWDGDDQAAFLKSRPKMYPTGRGHGLSDGHFPDDMLCSYYTKPLDGYGTLCNQDWQGDDPHSRQRQWTIYAMGTRQLVSGKAKLEGYFGPVPPDDPRYTPDGVKHLLGQLRQAALDSAKGKALDDRPDDVDVAVGQRLSRYVDEELQLPPAARFGDDPQDKLFLKEIHDVSQLGVTDPAKRCSDILQLIVGMKSIAALPGATNARCDGVWKKFADAAISQFVASMPSPPGALPVHGDWERIYRPDGSDKPHARPIDCYAAQVGARLAAQPAAKVQPCQFTQPH